MAAFFMRLCTRRIVTHLIHNALKADCQSEPDRQNLKTLPVRFIISPAIIPKTGNLSILTNMPYFKKVIDKTAIKR